VVDVLIVDGGEFTWFEGGSGMPMGWRGGGLSGRRTVGRKDRSGDRMGLGGGDDWVMAEESGKILGPSTEIGSGYAPGIVLGIVEEAKDVVDQKVGDGKGHSGKAMHEKLDGLFLVKVERRTRLVSGIRPRIVVVEHVDEDDTQ
jgi:hypothetical protein